MIKFKEVRYLSVSGVQAGFNEGFAPAAAYASRWAD